MIPRLVYLYTTHNGVELTMRGYVNNSLSVYSISQIPTDSMPEDDSSPSWFSSASVTTCRWACPPGLRRYGRLIRRAAALVLNPTALCHVLVL